MIEPTPLYVLVVEDDPDTRENLRDLLEEDGHRVALAGSMTGAIGRDDLDQFDVALIDRRLPDGNAEDLLPRFRSLAPDCSPVLVTAWCDLDSILVALRGGIFDYLVKPLDPGALRATLRRLSKLREADRRAKQAEHLASLGQMLTVLAHEGRNALNKVKMGLDLAARTCRVDTEAGYCLEIARSGCIDLERLFNDLRGYAGPIRLDRRPCSVAEVARHSWADLEPSRSGRSARLRVEGCGAGQEVPADAFRLRQVFRNLFENALAACPDPVEVLVRCDELSLPGPRSLRVRVRDNGPGFEPGARSHAFEPFSTTKPEGTGLGLAISRRIIEAHGGRIVLTDASQGAEFQITLPLEFDQSDGHPALLWVDPASSDELAASPIS